MTWYVDPAVLRARHKPALAQEHSVTSRAAAAKIEPRRGTLQTIVYLYIKSCSSGATDEEGMEATGIVASTYRPRRVELVEAGRIVDSGRTRKTRSGREAVVWVAA
jgi:hypothetical protein